MLSKSEQEGRYLYIIDGALSAFNYGQAEDGAAPGAGGVDGGVAPVPPCIQHTSTGTVRVAVELDDRARARAVTKITADEVGVSLQTRANVAQDELLEFMGKVLRLRLPQMSLVRGWSTRSKLLMVQGLTAREVYDRLRAAMEEHRAKISPPGERARRRRRSDAQTRGGKARKDRKDRRANGPGDEVSGRGGVVRAGGARGRRARSIWRRRRRASLYTT